VVSQSPVCDSIVIGSTQDPYTRSGGVSLSITCLCTFGYSIYFSCLYHCLAVRKGTVVQSDGNKYPWTFRLLKVRPPRFLETMVTCHPVTRRQVAEEQRLQIKNFHSRIDGHFPVFRTESFVSPSDNEESKDKNPPRPF
jgi:hypothetical protein